jgi:hypothetical protein
VQLKRTLPWLAIALLFALAAWLFSLGEAPTTPPAHPVNFPHPPAPEVRRPIARPLGPLQKAAPAQSARPRDPLLAALPGGPGASAVVLEANALRNSPIGELFIDCLRASDAGMLEQLRDHFGVDPLKDLDRVALGQEGMVTTGEFAGAHWDQLFDGKSPTSYGDQAHLYDIALDGGVSMVATRWGDQLFSMSMSQQSARSMVDRLEGRGGAQPQVLGDQQAYGDAYGVLGAPAIAALVENLLPPDQAQLRSRLLSAATNVEFHLDASHDLALTAEVQGTDPEALADLGRSLGAAFAIWRVYAQANNQPELAALLDQAAVSPGNGRFEVRLALPLEVLKARFANCRNWK